VHTPERQQPLFYWHESWLKPHAFGRCKIHAQGLNATADCQGFEAFLFYVSLAVALAMQQPRLAVALAMQQPDRPWRNHRHRRRRARPARPAHAATTQSRHRPLSQNWLPKWLWNHDYDAMALMIQNGYGTNGYGIMIMMQWL